MPTVGWNDASELVVANNGEVYIAPVGTALPTTPTAALNAAFKGLGFVDENGVGITVNPDVVEIGAWQARQPIRRELNKQDIQAVFALQQWNEDTVPFALGGGSVSGSGPYTVTPPTPDAALVEYAMVIDAVDGSIHTRWVFPRGNVTELGEITHKRNETTMLHCTFKVLEPTSGGDPFQYLTDSPAFVAGS